MHERKQSLQSIHYDFRRRIVGTERIVVEIVCTDMLYDIAGSNRR